MTNPVTWFEIAATDLERAKTFYVAVFGVQCSFVDMPGSPMYMMGSDMAAPGAAGAIVKSENNTPFSGLLHPAWLIVCLFQLLSFSPHSRKAQQM